MPYNPNSTDGNLKANIELLADLSTNQKEEAYKIMQYVYQPAFYSRKHCISPEKATALVMRGLATITGVTSVMY